MSPASPLHSRPATARVLGAAAGFWSAANAAGQWAFVCCALACLAGAATGGPHAAAPWIALLALVLALALA